MSFTPLKTQADQKPKTKLDKLKLIGLIGVFLILIIGIGYTVFYLYKPTITSKKAVVWQRSVNDTCNKIQFNVSESASCPHLYDKAGHNQTCPVNGQKNEIKNYSITMNMRSLSTTAHTVVFRYAKNFCDTACGTWTSAYGGMYSCSDTKWTKYETITATVPGYDQTNPQSYTFTIGYADNELPTDVCGTFQHDIWVDSVDGDTNCNIKDGEAVGLASWGYCQTGIDCPQPSPTPSPTPEITNTPTPTPSPTTPVPSATPTPTPTTTPGPSATPTPTNTPTPTPNPKCGDSCSNNSQCPGDHLCNGGKCVLAQCVQAGVTCDSSKCSQIAPSNTPVPTETILTYIASTPGPTSPPKSSPTLAETGGYGRWPFIIGPLLIIGIGLLL